MDYNDKLVEEIVEYCGGDKKLVKEYIKKQNKKSINTIEELVKSPIKEHYSSLIDKKRAPMIRKYLIDGMDWDKHTKVSLDDVLEYIEDWEDYFDFDNSDINDKEQLLQELIKLRFGSMEYDW